MKLDSENMEDVAAWCGGQLFDNTLIFRSGGSPVMAQAGDGYLVKHAQGYRVLDGVSFENEWEPSTE